MPISVAAPGEHLAHGRRVEDLVDHAVAEGTRTVMAEEGDVAGEAPGMLGSSPRRIPLPASPR